MTTDVITEWRLDHLIVETHQSTGETDLGVLTDKVLHAIPASHLRDAVAQVLRSYVTKTMGLYGLRLREPEDKTTTPSKPTRTTSVRWARVAMMRRSAVQVPGVGGKALDDVSADDALLVAADRRQRAEACAVEADRWEAVARTLKKRKASSVAALSDEDILGLFAS